MREEGLRVTPQRGASSPISSTTNRTRPSTRSTIATRAQMPTISLKTVYQTVHDLEALGEVRLLDVGTGQVRVDPNVEHGHHHLVCNACGRVADVSGRIPQL